MLDRWWLEKEVGFKDNLEVEEKINLGELPKLREEIVIMSVLIQN